MTTPLMRPTVPVTIHRTTEGEDYDDYGQPVVTTEGIEASAIRIAPVSGQEVRVNRQTLTVAYSAAFPPDTDIRQTDSVTFYSGGEKTLDVAVVFGVPCPRRGGIKYLHVNLTEIEG